jgi:peroxin-7
MELHIPLSAQGFACKFSPYNGTLAYAQLAVASSQYYGLAGNGRAQVFALLEGGKISELAAFDTPQALFDIAWSECNAYQFVTGSADGSVCLWDVRASDGLPLAKVFTHLQEVSTVCWDIHSKSLFASASWDGRTVIFDASTLQQVAGMGGGTPGHVYDIEWHPVSRGLMATTIATHVAIWDTTCR